MADRLLGILGHELFKLGLGVLMFQEGRVRTAENAGKFRPEFEELMSSDADAPIRPFGSSAGEGARPTPRSPELFLGCEQDMLIVRISRNGKFDPLATAGNLGGLMAPQLATDI